MRELQGFIFIHVTQNGVRKLAEETFLHLHRLDLKFHLNRQTGALSRTIDRGTRAVTYLLNTTLLTLGPTIFEISLVCYILTSSFGFEYTALTLATLGAYSVFTTKVTKW